MENKKIILSIGIPTYKRPKRLKNILSTIASQVGVTDTDWEVVISDNCSEDETAAVAASFSDRLPIRYFVNEKNMGPDYNFRILADRAQGEYLWFVPDDDDFIDQNTLSTVKAVLRKGPDNLSAVLLNQKLKLLDTNHILDENTFKIQSDIFLNEGIDVLKQIDEINLLTGIGLVLKRGCIVDEFVEQYCKGSNLSPMAMALAACAKGSVFLVSRPLVYLGAGDSAGWRKRWSAIYFLDIPDLLKNAFTYYKLPTETFSLSLSRRKLEMPDHLYWHYFIFQRHGLSWTRFIEVYGFFYFAKIFLLSPFFIFMNLKLVKRLLNKKGILDVD